MRVPDTTDFLEVFGLEPIEEDPALAYCRFVIKQSSGQELEFSFSAVTESFEVKLQYGGRELMRVSSEKCRLIEIRRNQGGCEIHAVFQIGDATSEAVVTLEPDLHCHWWTLRS